MGNSIAIIPARGGSKRIPRKNIKDFCGKPIIAYSIEAALQSGIFDEVMVSTDDEEIAEVSRHYGASVPFFRNPETANDYATTAQVYREVLNEYKKRGQEFSYLCGIYSTAPFVTDKILRAAFEKMQQTDADSLIPIVRFSYPPQRAYLLEEGKIVRQFPQYATARSQDIPPVYHDCGQFIVVKTESFLQKGIILTDNTISIEIPEMRVQDLDTAEDWEIAEVKYKWLQEKQK